ncbi:MAG: hypothetical protein ACT4OJ_10035 [Bacteroidota bacterium]
MSLIAGNFEFKVKDRMRFLIPFIGMLNFNMKDNRLIFFLLLIGSCFSCQKETDKEAPGSTLLVRTVLRSGADSTVTTYSYDPQLRLIKEDCFVLPNGFLSELIINRNFDGVIATTVQRSPGFHAMGYDSVITRYNFNQAASRYTSSVLDMSVHQSEIDSTVYTYDASNRIVTDSVFVRVLPGPPFLLYRHTYTYAGTGNDLINVSIEKILTVGGPFTVIGSQDFTFDTQISPLILLNEAILLNRAGVIDYTNAWLYNMGNIFGSKNATKTIYTDIILPARNFTMDYLYWYNAFNMPDSSLCTRNPGGTASVRKYYYQ